MGQTGALEGADCPPGQVNGQWECVGDRWNEDEHCPFSVVIKSKHQTHNDVWFRACVVSLVTLQRGLTR
jgi:hypothetical protein